MIRVGVLGAHGRMGQRVAALLQGEFSDLAFLGATPARGDLLDELVTSDVVIDFASPKAVGDWVRTALTHGESTLPPLVVGSTGWTTAEKGFLQSYSDRARVLQSSNFSLGVLALLKVLKTSGPLFETLGYRPSLTEIHHMNKKDAPSGTALDIRAALQRQGAPDIPIESKREGEIIGIHEIDFLGPFDRITVRHEALDRDLFARGAIRVALWLNGKRPPRETGWISTDDFLTDKLSAEQEI